MLSGGEPTVHPEVLEIIEAATERNVTRVILNTNGIRIAKDDRFVAALGRLRGRVEVYLQFDGFELRFTPVPPRRGPARHQGRGAPAARRGAGLHDAGRRRRGGRQRPRGRRDRRLRPWHRLTSPGVAFQPVFGSGRIEPDRPDASRRRRPGRSTGSASRPPIASGRTTSSRCRAPIPTARRSPTSSGATAASGGPSRGCSGTERLKEYLGLVSNRIAPDDAMWTALVGMMSETTLVSPPGADRPPPPDLRGVRPRASTGFVKTSGRWLFDRERRRRGDRAAGQALLGQDVHGRLDAERRAAAAVLRPRRLDRRRGEPRAHPVLCPAAVRRAAAAPHRRAWCRRASWSSLDDVRAPADPRRCGP